jgi:hypothetical protein
MLRVLLYALPIILAIYALVDLVQTPDDEVQGLPKLAWVVLIVLVWVIGPAAWLLAGKRGRSFLPRPQPRAAGGHGGPPPRQVAPDDDPDFLRGLGRSRPRPPSSPPAPPEPPAAPPGAERSEPDADDKPDDDPPLTAR